MNKKPEGSLLDAARALQEDLNRFETISAELSRAPINSEKSLQRARQTLESCCEQEAKLADSLRGFAAAMQEMQLTQQRCMEMTAEATQRIQQRQEQRMALRERLVRVGESAREVSLPVAELPEESATIPVEMLASLQEVERRLSAVIGEAAEISEIAQRDEWADVERDIQALSQQLQAVRNRVLLCQRKVASRAPS
jgi:hypothetical protein